MVLCKSCTSRKQHGIKLVLKILCIIFLLITTNPPGPVGSQICHLRAATFISQLQWTMNSLPAVTFRAHWSVKASTCSPQSYTTSLLHSTHISWATQTLIPGRNMYTSRVFANHVDLMFLLTSSPLSYNPGLPSVSFNLHLSWKSISSQLDY